MVVAQRPAAMQAGVGERLDLVRRGPDDQERQTGDVIDMGIADRGDVILVAGHLPDPFPQPLDLALVLFAGPVPVRGNLRCTRRHRRFFKIDRRRCYPIVLDHVDKRDAI